MKAWRRSGGGRTAIVCPPMVTELVLSATGGTGLQLDWAPGDITDLMTVQEEVAGTGLWNTVSEVVNPVLGTFAWNSSFEESDNVRIRLRITGSAESCAVLSNAVVLG